MSPAFRMILALMVLLIALAGVWRIWSAARPSPAAPRVPGVQSSADGPEVDEYVREYERQKHEGAERRRRSAEWLQSRAPHVGPVVGPESFEVPHAVERARPQLQGYGLSDRDVRTAVRHTAELLHLLFVRRDCDALTRWRLDYGYRFYPIERLRESSIQRRSIERIAQRQLQPHETDSLGLWNDYCRHHLLEKPAIRGLDLSPDGAIVLVTRSEQGLKVPVRTPPYRLSAPSTIGQSTRDPALPELLRLWAGGSGAVVWPFWVPPSDVEARLERPGVVFIEIAYVLELGDRTLQPISLVLGMDPSTRGWWVMQCYIPHDEHVPRPSFPLALGGI